MRLSYLRVVVATAVASVPVVACMGFGCSTKPLGTFDVTFTPCTAADGGAQPDGGECATTCNMACELFKPASQPGGGLCADIDAGEVSLALGQEVTVHCQALQDCTGRKLDGLAAPDVEGGAFGAWLARAAWLETSAVFAFRRLARELRAHGAPARLIAAARRSARDEIRHARVMTALARARGAVVPPVRVAPAPVRDLETIARENVVEGCVNETYGAAVAAWQAHASNDRDLATAMTGIAPDELRHAALGWAVHGWIETRLAPAARARVRAARDESARALLERTRSSPEEHALATALSAALWAA